MAVSRPRGPTTSEQPMRPAPVPDPLDALTALSWLEAGNRRFVAGKSWRGGPTGRAEMSKPFAAVLHCTDLHLSPEVLFDQDDGMLYRIGSLGPRISPGSRLSLDYASNRLGVALVVVLTHAACGLLQADHVSPPPASTPLAAIIDLVHSARAEAAIRSDGSARAAAVSLAERQAQQLRSMVLGSRITVVAATVDADDQCVRFSMPTAHLGVRPDSHSRE